MEQQDKRNSIMSNSVTMYVGKQEVHIGDEVRVVKAYSVLHYNYGMTGTEAPEYKGITGKAVRQSRINENAVCLVQIDDEVTARGFHDGQIRLMKDDEIEIISKGE